MKPQIDIVDHLRAGADPRGGEAADLIATLRAALSLSQRRARMAGKKVAALVERLEAIEAAREARREVEARKRAARAA